MKTLLPGVAAMAVIVVTSNILVQFLLFGGILTWGAFTYPFAFVVTDIMNRVYGAKAARRVVYAGTLTGIVCSLIGTQVMLAFGPAVVLRVAMGSATAFLVAQLMDVAVFNRLRAGSWWRAPLVSTLISSTLDTVTFFSIAFSATFNIFGAQADGAVAWAQAPAPFMTVGSDAPLWLSLALADFSVKLAIAIFALVPFRIIVGRLLQRPA